MVDPVNIQEGTMNPESHKWLALAILCVAQFMVILDVSIVNVALPSIERGLHFSEQNLLWVLNAYALFFGGFLMLGGRVADQLGRRRGFVTGPARTGGRSPVAGRPVHPDRHLRRGTGTEHGPQHLGGDRRSGRCVRR